MYVYCIWYIHWCDMDGTPYPITYDNMIKYCAVNV